MIQAEVRNLEDKIRRAGDTRGLDKVGPPQKKDHPD